MHMYNGGDSLLIIKILYYIILYIYSQVVVFDMRIVKRCKGDIDDWFLYPEEIA
jgi:hypothetical protein